MTSLQLFNKFCEEAMLNEKHDPWYRRRTKGAHYAHFVIASCRHEEWWYHPFIGVEFMGEMTYYGGCLRLEHDIKPVILVGVNKHCGRTIPVEDLIMI